MRPTIIWEGGVRIYGTPRIFNSYSALCNYSHKFIHDHSVSNFINMVIIWYDAFSVDLRALLYVVNCTNSILVIWIGFSLNAHTMNLKHVNFSLTKINNMSSHSSMNKHPQQLWHNLCHFATPKTYFIILPHHFTISHLLDVLSFNSIH